MRLQLKRSEVARLIASVSKAVESRNTIPILSCVKLVNASGTLEATASDLDVQISGAIPSAGDDMAFCVDAKLLTSILAKAAGEEIEVERTDDGVTIKAGRSRFKLQTLPVDDFPSIDIGGFTSEFETDLAALVAPVQFSISAEETRYYLNGVFLHVKGGRLTAVATDGHRLARHYGADTDAAFDGVILPRKLVGLLPKGVAKIALSQTKVRVVGEGVTIVSKLIDGTFPDYERVIPTGNSQVVTVERAALMKASDRVSVVSSERGRAVKFAIAPGSIDLTVRGDGEASDSVAADYSGEPFDIGFNAKYVHDVFATLSGENATMRLEGGGAPVIVTGAGDDLLCVLMPMRV